MHSGESLRMKVQILLQWQQIGLKMQMTTKRAIGRMTGKRVIWGFVREGWEDY
jgi:hypothetical protein